ncbi:late embryogenesis abundant protein At1g64065-like [Aristolochia californica]|uniref:late embryogenesis abundant protein At1g64065-like n=1 Tax=Aristolochia californica TaxID=171875 RepID=UPI0035DD8303
MGSKEDVRPLAPTHVNGDRDRGSSDIHDEEARWTSSRKGLRRRRCILFCGCCVSTILILAILILVLALTVFKVKDPEIKLNSVYLDRLSLGTSSSLNFSVTADISVKNPNSASFKFGNSTTFLSYRGETVGEAKTPAGKAKARRTLRMNVTVDVRADRLLGNSGQLARDLISDTLPVNAYTKLGGRVNLLNVFKRHVDVIMNCSITVSISTTSIEDQSCERSVKL